MVSAIFISCPSWIWAAKYPSQIIQITDVRLMPPTTVIPADLNTVVMISLMWFAEQPDFERKQTRSQVFCVKTPLCDKWWTVFCWITLAFAVSTAHSLICVAWWNALCSLETSSWAFFSLVSEDRSLDFAASVNVSVRDDQVVRECNNSFWRFSFVFKSFVMVAEESLNPFESWADEIASAFFRRRIWDVIEVFFEIVRLLRCHSIHNW